MKSVTILFLTILCAYAALADGLSYELSNCWKTSEFAVSGAGRRSRTADFSFLKTVKKETFNAWTNGVSIDSFYAYSSTGACNRIRRTNPSSYLCGLYSAATNNVYALSILGVKDLAMELVLPVELGGRRDLLELTVGYDAWKFTEKNPTALTFSACAIDDLAVADSADWTAYDVYTSGVSSVSRRIRIPAETLEGMRYVCFRWSVPNRASSSILGISDVTVTARLKPAGAVLMIR